MVSAPALSEAVPSEAVPFEAVPSELANRPAVVPPATRPRIEPGVRRFVERRLRRWAGTARTAVVTVPAPRVEPERLLELRPSAEAFLWDPGDGTVAVGLGAAHALRAAGDGRFGGLRRTADAVARRLAVSAADGCRAPVPRFFGGLAFAPGAADGAPWTGFGDAAFTLPRFLYHRAGRRASLTLAVRGDELAAPGLDGPDMWVAELAALLAELAAPAPPSRCGVARALRVDRPPVAPFRREIEAIRSAIAGGRFRKIVAAARTRIVLDGAAEPTAVLRRLAGAPRPTIRFAFRPRAGHGGGATFLGATPERLVARRGLRVSTEALAGSIARERAAELLGSAKDRHEQGLVVETVARRLAPLCDRLQVAAEPAIRELRDVAHLHTPITGTLAAPRHLLELAERLHPTPAVGGVPTAGALQWIAEREPEPRGWYASPVGWFDAAGDGELAVALRSAVLAGATAHLYAGAGIVADSDPDLEYREIELKKKTLLGALGISAETP